MPEVIELRKRFAQIKKLVANPSKSKAITCSRLLGRFGFTLGSICIVLGVRILAFSCFRYFSLFLCALLCSFLRLLPVLTPLLTPLFTPLLLLWLLLFPFPCSLLQVLAHLAGPHILDVWALGRRWQGDVAQASFWEMV